MTSRGAEYEDREGASARERETETGRDAKINIKAKKTCKETRKKRRNERKNKQTETINMYCVQGAQNNK